MGTHACPVYCLNFFTRQTAMKPDSPALNWTVGFEPDSLVQNWTSGKTLVKTWLVVESYQSEIVILHYFYKIKCYNNYFKNMHFTS